MWSFRWHPVQPILIQCVPMSIPTRPGSIGVIPIITRVQLVSNKYISVPPALFISQGVLQRVGRVKIMKRSRPHLWKSGPDPELRARRLAFLRSRCQARYRGEPWSLTLDEWCQLWSLDRWRQRGRSAENLILTRKNIDAGWDLGNCEVRYRRGNMSRHHQHHRNHLGSFVRSVL